MSISYRTLRDDAEFEQVTDLEMLVWGMLPRQAISSDVLHVVSHTGGHVLGAFDGKKLVGCTVAFAMREPERLWSHMAAVHPDYQSQGLGYALKQRQREWAMEQGYRRMSWTFDPLQRRNAHFNFHRLGAECQRYHENFYGEMADGLNAGLPTDRFELIWEFAPKERLAAPAEAPFLLKADAPEILAEPSESWHFVAIPYEIQQLKAENLQIALAWRWAMRQVFQAAFAQGYKVVDFQQEESQKSAWYCLYRAGL